MRSTFTFLAALTFLLGMAGPTMSFSPVNQEPVPLNGKETVPTSFRDRNEAEREGCKVHKLKSHVRDNCVIERFDPQDSHELLLEVYDSDTQSRFLKAEQIRLSSWYNKAKVGYGDLLGDGREFIFIESEGNTGTGTLQMILTVIGWNDRKFFPVLMETVSFYEQSGLDSVDLLVSYRFTKLGTRSASLHLAFLYHEVGEETSQRSISWTNSLKWNERAFSFYDKNVELSKIKNAKFAIKKNISQSRLKVVDVDLGRRGHDSLQRTGIMGILNQ